MDLEFLAQTDAATIRFELAKRQLEAAKAELDAAKQFYDDMLNKADDHGFAKSKLKKLSDDRVFALFEAGIVQFEAGSVSTVSPATKPARMKKAKKKNEELAIDTDETSVLADEVALQSLEGESGDSEPSSLDL